MAPSGGGPDTGTEPAIPAQAREPAIPVQARGTEQPPAERVNKPGELWRIEGSLTAVRAEITQLESLDDSGLRSRVSELERRWRAQLAAVLPGSFPVKRPPVNGGPSVVGPGAEVPVCVRRRHADGGKVERPERSEDERP